jgi:heat shock protein HtpX
MSAWKLYFSMATTLAAIFGLTTLGFVVVLTLFGYGISLWAIGVLVVLFNVVQWLISPYIVGAMYRAKPVSESENPQLHRMVSELSIKSGIKKPQIMLARVPFPNAFAYGSPLTGSRVAVTEGLLNSLNAGEVEAVVGHELGHLKHRDVQVMMVVSFLPALFYYIGYSLMWSGILGGGRNRNDNGGAAIIGIGLMVFSWILTLFTLYLSRLREYYADRHSAAIVENGAEKLSMGLVSIVEESKRASRFRKQSEKTNTSFKALFIADPDRASVDTEQLHSTGYGDKKQLLRDTLAREPSSGEKLLEIFSTHPNMIKRLRALQELQKNQRKD